MELRGARVMDLFAGTGALGLEALSRGARELWLVEKNPQAATVISHNLAVVTPALSHQAATHLIRSSVSRFLATAPTIQADVVFLDPPYEYSSASLASALKSLAPWLAEGALVVVERSAKSGEPEWPEGMQPLEPRTYGDTLVSMAQFEKGSQPPVDGSSF
ncbi:MAG: rRNA ((966)-N(2))-methyltransferase RsmD [Actinomycetota bacterium]